MTTERSESAGAAAEAPRAIAVLLVDDQRFVGMAVGRLLANDKDIELHYCERASDAVGFANRIGPAVILQDLVMPDIDGVTLVGLFRANPATATTPIVVLSGNDDESTRAQAKAAGANDYLVKLPDRSTLVACIRRHHAGTPAKRSALDIPPEPSAVKTPTAPPRNVVNDTTSDEQTLDRSVIAGFRETGGPGATQLVTTLIDQFLQETASLVATLKQAARRADAAALKAAAHSLKGTSNTMGARRLAALAAQLEEHVQRDPAVALELMVVAIEEERARVERVCLVERAGGPRPVSQTIA